MVRGRHRLRRTVVRYCCSVMTKYIVAFVIVLGITVYVSVQDKHAAQNAPPSALSGNVGEKQPPKQTANPERNLPVWYGFFRWPDGTTTWAIVLTLFAIAEQTRETSRSVAIAKAQVIASNRPKLVIRGMSLIPGKIVEVDGVPRLEEDPVWRIRFVIANIGGSRATVTESNLTMFELGVGTLQELIPGFPPYSARGDAFEGFMIEPGERQERTVLLEEIQTRRLKFLKSCRKQGTDTTNLRTIFFGFAHYRDDSGVGRRTGFGAEYDAEKMTFMRLDAYPDYEYSD
jgi:hypothetical protein